MYILNVEYLIIINVVMIYFYFIIVNMPYMSFTIGIMIKYTAGVSCRFASIGNLYNVYYRWHSLLTMVVTGISNK